MSDASGGARAVRPPNASEAAIRSCFSRIQRIGEPGELVDAKWVDNYNLGGAESHEIVGLLKWLGIIDSSGASTGVWNDLRADLRAALAALIRKAYAPIFSAVDVEAADRKMVEGAFISAYKTGNPGRLVTAFLTLCSVAGIVTVAGDETKGVEGSEASGPPVDTRPGVRRPSADTASASATTSTSGRRSRAVPHPGRAEPATPTSITFNVEIPADWDAARVRQRVAEVLEAIRSAQP